MDLSKLTTADKVILASAILLTIFMFFSWYGIEDIDGGLNGWDYWLGGIIPWLLGVVMAAQVALSRFSPQTKLPDPPVPWTRVHLIAGAAAAVILILRLIIGSDIDTAFGDFSLDRKFGLILAVLSGLGLAAGGFLKSKEPESGVAGPSSSGPATPF